jgi:hypothetical protein
MKSQKHRKTNSPVKLGNCISCTVKKAIKRKEEMQIYAFGVKRTAKVLFFIINQDSELSFDS